MKTIPSTRYSLILGIQDPKNQAAWAEFVELYEPVIYRIGRRCQLQDCDAKDLCQDVFRAVAGAARRWIPDSQRPRFRAYLYCIARNKVLNFLRSRARRADVVGGTSFSDRLRNEPDASQSTEHKADFEHRQEVFRVAAAAVKHEFTECTWLAFWQTAVEGTSTNRVAMNLGISVGAVYIARSRVMARLREYVEQIEGEA